MQHSPGSTPVWGYLSPVVALRARQNLIHILRQVDPLRYPPQGGGDCHPSVEYRFMTGLPYRFNGVSNTSTNCLD